MIIDYLFTTNGDARALVLVPFVLGFLFLSHISSMDYVVQFAGLLALIEAKINYLGAEYEYYHGDFNISANPRFNDIDLDYPIDVYGPLEEVLREGTIDGTPLGDVMFGEIRRYRGGGKIHVDVMFDGLEVRLPGRSDPITMGVTSGYDFFSEHAVYVEGFAQDATAQYDALAH